MILWNETNANSENMSPSSTEYPLKFPSPKPVTHKGEKKQTDPVRNPSNAVERLGTTALY